jgi:hypothetical protein
MSTDITPYEPPNNAKQEEYESVYPPSGSPSGEEPVTPDKHDTVVFSDTGGTMRDFACGSKHAAKVLKHS